MSLSLVDAKLHVTEATSDTDRADFVVPRPDILSASWTERAGRPLDTGQIVLDNRGGKYSAEDAEFRVDVDDELVLYVSWEGDEPAAAFGERPFGQQPFGDIGRRAFGPLIVTDWSATGQEWAGTLTLDVETFVFNRLAAVTVHERFDGAPISGSDDAILNEVLENHVPEVGRDRLPDIPDTADYFVDGKYANKVVDEIATLARAVTGDAYVTAARRKDLVFEKVADIEPVGTFTAGDHGDLAGVPEHAAAAEGMANEVRVEGGIDDQDNIDEEQKSEDSWQTVTRTSRVTYQLAPSKPEITRVRAKIRRVTGSDDDLRVRLHPDDGGAPRDLGDRDLDYASGRHGVRFTLDEGESGIRQLRLGEHILGPKDNPWLVFESDGEDGVEVRVDANGNPWFETHFSKPVIVELPDQVSQSRFRTHEKTIQNDALETFNAARDRADAELARHGVPRHRFGPMEAHTERAHQLAVADAVTLPFDWLRADGDYLCTQVAYDYDGDDNNLTTHLEFHDLGRYA